MDLRQTFVTGASWDTNDLITFLGQKVKVQGHTIAAEAHSTVTLPSSATFSSSFSHSLLFSFSLLSLAVWVLEYLAENFRNRKCCYVCFRPVLSVNLCALEMQFYQHRRRHGIKCGYAECDVRRTDARGPKGEGFLGRGQHLPPPHQLEGLGSAVSSPIGVLGRSPRKF